MGSCTLNCWNSLSSNLYAMSSPDSIGWHQISIKKGFNRLPANFYTTTIVFTGQIPAIKENSNIKLIKSIKNSAKTDYHCYYSSFNGGYQCSSTSSFIFYARLLVNYEPLTYPVIGVDFQKTICSNISFSSIASVFDVSELTLSFVSKSHSVSIIGVCPIKSLNMNTLTSSEMIQLLSTLNYDLTGCMVNCSNHGLCRMN